MESLCKVLVADDEFRVRDLCHMILDKMGCDVRTASSGEEALSLLENGVDILLTDLLMEGAVGGAALAEKARAGEKTDVIIMTGYPDTDSAVKAVKHGVFDYLVKPFNAAALRLSIQRCVQRREAERLLRREKDRTIELDRAHEDLAWIQKVKEIYGPFTADSVVQLAMERPQDFWKKGEERDVSLLLAEVTGFSEATEGTSAEEKVRALNRIFGILADAIRAEMGHIHHLQGETIHALFNAPVPVLDHSSAAVRAAWRIKTLWQAFMASSRGKGLENVNVRVAVHSGKVVVGCLGVSGGSEYSAIGPEAKTAEKLLWTARPGQVLASAPAVRRAENGFQFRTHGLLIGAPYPGEVLELENR